MLEAVFILNTTLASVRGIATWIEQLHSKQQKLRQLKRTVDSLTMVLETLRQPSETATLDKSIVALLYDVAEILNGVKEHLSLCSSGGKTKMSKIVNAITLLNPPVVLGMLYDDEKRLSQWISLFTLSLQIATLREQAGKSTTPGPSPRVTLDTAWMPPSNDDISSFWLSSFGEESVFVSSDEFIAALQKWIQEELDETTRNALLLELDRKGIGGVTRRALDGFACERTSRECIDDLRAQRTMSVNSLSPVSPMNGNLPPISSPWISSSLSPSSSMSLDPTLVWIDDKIENNKAEVNYAVSRQIRVIQHPTTAIAKLWIEQSDAELQMLERNGLLHFITDNARWEAAHAANTPGDLSLNMSAGESILRYLRGRGFKAPVLVYCGRSIRYTSYVTAYSHAASTTHPAVCLAFIEQLVATVTEDGVAEEDGFWSSFVVGKGLNLVA